MSLAVLTTELNLGFDITELKLDTNGKINSNLDSIDTIIYLGNKINIDEYSDIEEELYLKGVRMFIDINEYRSAGDLKKAYSKLAKYMPKMEFISKNTIAWNRIKKEYKTFIIKDDRKYIGIYNWNTSNDELNTVIQNCENPVVMEYLTPELDSDANTEEYSIWMLENKPEIITGYDKSRTNIAEWIKGLDLNINSKFYRLKVLVLENNRLMITDIEDGQIAMMNESKGSQKKLLNALKYLYEHEV